MENNPIWQRMSGNARGQSTERPERDAPQQMAIVPPVQPRSPYVKRGPDGHLWYKLDYISHSMGIDTGALLGIIARLPRKGPDAEIRKGIEQTPDGYWVRFNVAGLLLRWAPKVKNAINGAIRLMSELDKSTA